MSVVIAITWVVVSHGGIDRLGRPLGTDFVSFWTAGRLVLAGDSGAPYRPAEHAAAEQAVFPAVTVGYYAFFYPPVALLMFWPLAMLPYLAALVVWLVGTGFAALVCVRHLLPQRWALLPILAFPAVLVNAGHGQNGFLSTACIGGGMILHRRPLLAGMCLGALVFKPQLALLVPVGLLAARRWRMLAGASLSAFGLCLASWLLMGEAAWRGFLDIAPLARLTLETGLVDPGKMVSTFAAVRLLHGDVAVAYALQAAVTAGTGLVLALALARRPGGCAEGALLAAAAMLATPFLLDYDLVIMALPLAWTMAEAQRFGWQPWEKLTVLAAYALPLIARPIAMSAGIPLAPLVLAGLLAVVMRRVKVNQHGAPVVTALPPLDRFAKGSR